MLDKFARLESRGLSTLPAFHPLGLRSALSTFV